MGASVWTFPLFGQCNHLPSRKGYQLFASIDRRAEAASGDDRRSAGRSIGEASSREGTQRGHAIWVKGVTFICEYVDGRVTLSSEHGAYTRIEPSELDAYPLGTTMKKQIEEYLRLDDEG